jgi:2-polyprenyl-3-methyl-5-hydroxy-6-metoxy-1,4-benzoquinol methylase
MPEDMSRLVDDQIAYYRARAGEYDDWFLRRGRYDHGAVRNTEWTSETEQLRTVLDTFAPAGRVLELACGTGLFTQHLLRHADSITAVDSSPEVIRLNQLRCDDPRITYIQANLFDWVPNDTFDVVFFSFWLSHVPPERFASFWNMVRTALAPSGRVFLIDSQYEPSSTAVDHVLKGPDSTTATRRLDDGREFEIVKVFYRPEELVADLDALGWHASIRTTGRFFIYGHAVTR